MKLFNWQVGLGLALALCSTLVYTAHYLLFRDPHHLFMFLVGDIAFVFIEVLLVTMILHRLLETREKKAKLQKLNMVIGSFFSELGTPLLRLLSGMESGKTTTRERFMINDRWSSADFAKASKEAAKKHFAIDAMNGNLEKVKELLQEKRLNVLRALENPNILEHEHFTDLLWAVFHLGEEMSHRSELGNLSDNDRQHLCGDMARAYTHLLREWLAYMHHLQRDYPYLYSLAVRLNPFDPEARAELC